MTDVFLQYNHQIEVFQSFLTSLAIVLEIYAGLLGLAGIFCAIAGSQQTVAPVTPTAPVPEISSSNAIVRNACKAKDLPLVNDRKLAYSRVPQTKSPQPKTLVPGYSNNHLSACTVRQLKQMAKDRGLIGFSRMSKANLILALVSSDEIEYRVPCWLFQPVLPPNL